ncbi:MAG: IS21 family transposase [Deltaproteobacteria bacterium]|nr:IS21 family transposase [Myxococcales bacterium]MDP3214663.1 IS21 family transposase [Deltaproteobacteria bacterium]
MTTALDQEAEVRRLFFAEHWRVGTIVAQLGLHREVVLRITGLDSPRRLRPRAAPAEETAVTPFVDFIAETLQRYPRLRATRLYDMLTPRGYRGSVRTLRRYVGTVRPVARRGVFLRLETLMGEQAQVDWAFIGDRAVPGGRRGLWLFVMVLSWSRMLFAECVWDLTAASLRRSLIRAHAFFGGAPRQWLFDNPRTIVLGRQGDSARFHPTVVELSSAFCTQARLCTVRAPQEKGRVERAVRYVRDRFLAGREIHDVVQGNRELEAFLRDIAPARPHPRLPDCSVGDAFLEERPRLLPLPDPMPSEEHLVPVAIDRTAFARLDTNLYSVPAAYAGRTLVLAADDGRVRLLDGPTEVAAHARSWGRRQVFEQREHRAQVVAERRAARDLKGRDRLRAEVPGIDPLLERWMAAGRNLGNAVGRTIVALDLYGAAAVRAAVAEALARGSEDPGALGHLCEQQRRASRQPVPTPVRFGDHVRDADVIPHDLGGYDE